MTKNVIKSMLSGRSYRGCITSRFQCATTPKSNKFDRVGVERFRSSYLRVMSLLRSSGYAKCTQRKSTLRKADGMYSHLAEIIVSPGFLYDLSKYVALYRGTASLCSPQAKYSF